MPALVPLLPPPSAAPAIRAAAPTVLPRAQLPGVVPETAAALDVRARALAHGVDPASRPADVAAIAATAPAPFTGTLSVVEARRAQQLVREALTGLTPRIQVNMPATEAVRLLSTGARFRNVYDMIDAPAEQRPQLATDLASAVDTRVFHEQARGFFGTGTTVYGTVHFGDEVHTSQIDHTRPLRYDDRRLDTGATMYGDASVILGERALRNSSFLPRDTGMTALDHPLRAVEQLDDLVVEYLVRNFELARAAQPGETTDTAFPGFRSPAEIASNFRAILGMPNEQAVASLREHLTSDAINKFYIEAQIRVADGADIVAVHMQRPSIADMDAKTVAAARATQDQLGPLGEQRGVTVRYSDEPLPPRRLRDLAPSARVVES